MTTYVDNFTEASGTPALTSHTPDSGGSWTEQERTGTAAAAVVAATTDTCRPSDSASTGSVRTLYTVSWTPAGNQYDVSAVATAIVNSTTKVTWLIARFTGTASYYAAGVEHSGHNPDVHLVAVTAGPTRTLLASGNVAPAVGETFLLEIRTAAKKFYQAGVERLSSTNNDITDTGVCGLGMGNIGDVTTAGVHSGSTWDAFTLDDSASSGAAVFYPVWSRAIRLIAARS
jgi:hypothetical protein